MQEAMSELKALQNYIYFSDNLCLVTSMSFELSIGIGLITKQTIS